MYNCTHLTLEFLLHHTLICFSRIKHLSECSMLYTMCFSFCLFLSFCPDIFTQQCHFLRQSGHSEKAISLFQAMIDFTFFKPDSVRELSTKQQVCLFDCVHQSLNSQIWVIYIDIQRVIYRCSNKEEMGSCIFMCLYVCLHAQVEFFEPFWDSGEARVGELGARGWKAWMLQQERGGWLQPSAGKTHTHTYTEPWWESWNWFLC